MKTYKLEVKNGTYLTEPILSQEEWLSVLHAADNDQHQRQLDVLRMFLIQTGHKATCSQIGKLYSMNDSAVNKLVVHFTQFAQKACGKEFQIEDPDKINGESFWPLAMYGRHLKNKLFEWELRPELVSALQDFLLEKLLLEYRRPVIEEGLDNSRSKELYKWRVLASCAGGTAEEILTFLASKSTGMNFITWRTQSAIGEALKDHHKEIIDCFSLLLTEGKTFYENYAKFVEYGKTFLSKKDADRILKEKEAALFLACSNPQTYPVYKWTLYKDACVYLGIDTKEAKPVDGYMAILQRIIGKENQDAELIAKLKAETAPYFWSEMLNAQDVLYQMQSFMQASLPKNWLQRQYDLALSKPNNPFERWFPAYESSVKRFQAMFDDGKTAQDVDEDTKDFFIRRPENFISKNSQGTYSRPEYEKFLEHWDEIYDILARNVHAGTINPDDYDALNKLISPLTVKDRQAAFHRLWSGLFPELLTTVISNGYFYDAYNKVRSVDGSLPEGKKSWLEDNLTLMEHFDNKVNFRHPWHKAIFAWYLTKLSDMNDNNTDMEEYIELINANKNLVLTGAPGTGKTYLAKQIACSLILGKSDFASMTEDEQAFFNEHYKLVQFHPSYDYTDFVEGLRPVKQDQAQIGFKRQDGVIKQLCEAAIINLEEANKSVPEQKQEQTVKQMVLEFVNDAIAGETAFQTKTGKPFTIAKLEDNAFYVYSKEVGESLIRVPLKDLYALIGKERPMKVTDIRALIGRRRTQQYDSYLYSIWEQLDNVSANKSSAVNQGPNSEGGVKRENFVLIIDEINRGELSKIFGEVFFSIDPGYRGKAGRVQTQYQNLIEEDDVFFDGFYVPENVYIIGTMNDIDRGVESMDFAIRRRFAWKEVKAQDQVAMLDTTIPEWNEEAKARMASLNKALKRPEIGLTDAYDIGPAYFINLKRYGGDFAKLWEYHIKPVLQEYLRGTRDMLGKIQILKEAFDNPQEEKND